MRLSGAVNIVFPNILTLEFKETKFILQNSDLLLRSATPVKDDDVHRLIKSLCLEEYLSKYEAQLDVGAYYDEVLNWFKTSSRVHFQPPPEFKNLKCSGITDGFNDFYVRHSARDPFIFRGEYPYHKDVFESLNRPVFYIDNTEITDNAFVIMSVPFSATGAIHPRTIEVLETCSRLQVPVFLDFAFLGLGAEIDAEKLLSYSCVDSFAFSFSKLFALGRTRAGWTWTKATGGPLHVVNQWKYTNWLGHFVARACLRHFSFDHMYVKYAPLQKQICAELKLQPSESFLFGLGDHNYAAFHRQKTVNRVCISPLLKQESGALAQRALDSSTNFTIG